MQLSSKASPVVLKPFTNVHSPFWHSSFQHLTHTLPKPLGTNATATTTSNLLSLLTACCLVMVHHCPGSISPSLCSCSEQQPCRAPFCSGAPRCQHPPSSLAKCQGSSQGSSLGWQCWDRPGSGRKLGSPKLEGCKSKARCPSITLQRGCWREAKSGWEERLNQEKIFLFYTITHSPLPTPATACPRSLTQSNAWHYPDTCF